MTKRVDLQEEASAGKQSSACRPLVTALEETGSVFCRSLSQVFVFLVLFASWVALGLPALWVICKFWRRLKRGEEKQRT